MSSPIMEFSSEKQMYACLKEWQERLFLQDWIIMVRLCDPDEFTLKEVCGENVYVVEIQSCVIKILKPEHFSDRIVKYCAEMILIHELLHCKYNWVERDYSSIEIAYYDTLEHQLLEQMSKSLLMAKYALPFEWFRNFEPPNI